MNLAFLKIKSNDKREFPYIRLGNDAPFMNGKDRVLLNSAVVIGKAKGENFVNAIKPANSRNNFSIFASGIERLIYQKENGIQALVVENSVKNPAIVAETAGGAIIDMDGKLIGISAPSTDFIGNVNQNAISVSVIKKAIHMTIPGIIKVEDTTFLGIEIDKKKDFVISQDLRRLLKIPPGVKHFGLEVKSVNLKSLAYNAGIQPGDVILKFNNEIVTNEDTLRNLETFSSVQQAISLKLLRKNNLVEIEIYR